MNRGHLLFLLLLTVKGEEPSQEFQEFQEFCLTFCGQAGAMQAVKRCELCLQHTTSPPRKGTIQLISQLVCFSD